MSELGASIYDEEFRNKIELLQWILAKRILKAGVSVILENGFWSKQERETYRARARNSSAEFFIHYLPADRDTLIERIKTRNKHQPNIERISLADIDTWIRMFEPPTTEELSGANCSVPAFKDRI